jgi:hypothetical protein
MKKWFESKTIWFFGVVALAAGFKLVTGVDFGTGVSDQSSTITEALAFAGVLLRFATNKPVTP